MKMTIVETVKRKMTTKLNHEKVRVTVSLVGEQAGRLLALHREVGIEQKIALSELASAILSEALELDGSDCPGGNKRSVGKKKKSFEQE